MITKEILRRIYPNAKQANIDTYAGFLDIAMQQYNINNANRMCAFLSQIGVESGQLAHVTENLNYSAERLLVVFPKYFSKGLANKYALNPVAIANTVYSNRLGNGDFLSNDGYKYRGRGLIQLTGKDNYSRASKGVGTDLINNPELLETPKYASVASAWFWESNGLNAIADKLGRSDDAGVFKLICKRVNGGYNGLNERIALYTNAKKYIV